MVTVLSFCFQVSLWPIRENPAVHFNVAPAGCPQRGVHPSPRTQQPSPSNLLFLSPAYKVLFSLKLPSRHVCQPSVMETCYTTQHVGCCELICDLYQSLLHQLWVGSTSVAGETSVKFSTGIVCSPSHVPPPCWRTHYAISFSLITLEGAAPASLSLTPPSLPLSLNRHTLGQKLHHPILPPHMGRKKPCLIFTFQLFVGLAGICVDISACSCVCT